MQTAIYDINELLSTEEGAAALKSTEANNPLSPVGNFISAASRCSAITICGILG